MRSKIRGGRVAWAVALAVFAAPLHAQQGRDGTIARLVEMNGNVLVSRDAGLASGNESLRVLPGSRVITTAHSEVVVEYDNGCRVKLKENQRFEVETGKPCALLIAQDLLLAPAGTAAPVANLVVPALIGGGGVAMLIDTRNKPSVSPN